MTVSNGRISAPISANDPYDLLGVPKQESGWDIGYICRDEKKKINKWAKYKPIRDSNLVSITDDRRKSLGDGLNIPKAGTYAGNTRLVFFHEIINGFFSYQVPNYTYSAPRGADFNEPYRLLDFVGYNHSAEPINGIEFFNDPYVNRKPTEINYSVTKQIQTGITPNISVDSVRLTDLITQFGGDDYKYYACCEVMIGQFATSRDKYVKTIRADNPLTSGDGYSIKFELSSEDVNKTYTLFYGVKYYDKITNTYDENRNFVLYSTFMPCRIYSIVNYFAWQMSTTHFCVDYATKRWHDVYSSAYVTSNTQTIYLRFEITQIPESEFVITNGTFTAFNTYGNLYSDGEVIDADLVHIGQVIVPRGTAKTIFHMRFNAIAYRSKYQSMIIYYNKGGVRVEAASAVVNVSYGV